MIDDCVELPDLALQPFLACLRASRGARAPRPRPARERLVETLAERSFELELGACMLQPGPWPGETPLPFLEASVRRALEGEGIDPHASQAVAADAVHVARFYSDLVGAPCPEVRLSLKSSGREAASCSLHGLVARYALAGAVTASAPRLVVDRAGAFFDLGASEDSPQLLLEVFSSMPPWFEAAAPVSERPRDAQGAEVVLVSMPFGPVIYPALGLSLLQGTLRERTSRILYLNLALAETIGPQLYQWISLGHPVDSLAGEWLFARALHGDEALDDEAYLAEVLKGVDPALVSDLLSARRAVEPFVDACVETIARHQPRLVGFTSTFQQHVPSLALARRLSETMPHVALVMGGANCEGAMGEATAQVYPFLDAVVSGEGEPVFPELVERLLSGRSVTDLPGVYTKDSAVHSQRQPWVEDMDALPVPDFSDFFDTWATYPALRRWRPALLMETARGCWWGQRGACTFCGLNGERLAFRSKSPARALEELTHLVESHRPALVQVVDNIMDMRYFDSFLPALEREGISARLFYETKANLKKEQVRQLSRSGVRSIQPGIESLSDAVLKLMRKGVRAIQCLQLLKWCQEMEVEVHWNLLWGFPGEPEAAYEAMVDLVPLLHHLPPPGGYGRIRLDRFSPNFEEAAKHGIASVRPWPAYRHLHPGQEVHDLAAFFDFEPVEGRCSQMYTAALVEAIEGWRLGYAESALLYLDKGSSGLVIWDTRPVAPTPMRILSGMDRQVFLACDEAQSIEGLQRALGAPLSVEEAVARLEAQRLLVRLEGRALTLATRLNV